VRQLLRDGADIHAKPTPRVPSPLERAQLLPETASVRLVQRAAKPWSPANHELFPNTTRCFAVELLQIGILLARSPRFEDQPCSSSQEDVWL